MILNKKDKIGIIALSGACDVEKIEQAAINIQRFGFETELSKTIYAEDRYLAGNDEEKINELYRMYRNSDIKLILNARGGYGTTRLLNKINYEIIRNNPKPIVGYSDITALLLMIYKKTGQVTYHGPMGVNFADGIGTFSFNNMIKALRGEQLNFKGYKAYVEGSAKGIIWGGNLATVTSMCGIDFIPDEDFIFFAEDIGEPVYKIDRMFTQLFNIDKFKNRCKGIILGDFIGIDNVNWLDELFNRFPCPAVGGFRISHEGEQVTIPIGMRAKLTNNTLVID